jgi:NADPH-dependent glutamate synthase beta subunit-like oxidoreductase
MRDTSSAPPYRVTLLDVDWFERNVPCRARCPVHTNAQAYVSAIGDAGDYGEAYRLARAPNPLVTVCSRVCGHPCEYECRRGKVLDEPIAIRALKRFACDHGAAGAEPVSPPEQKLGKVAILGSGPAGLGAAHELALRGYRVTIFESQQVTGGMLRLGIPEYRLPRDVLQANIEGVLELGVELKTGVTLGEEFTLADLRAQGYSAFFLAVGANKGRRLAIPGSGADGVVNGLDFLLNVHLGYRIELGERVVVVGGGNVAIDVARTVIRQSQATGVPEADSHLTELGFRRMDGTAVDGALHEAIDVARLAARAGAKEVHMVCLEARHEMPAHECEVEETLEEGIRLHCSRGPTRIVEQEGRVTGLESVHCSSVFDEQGQFNPELVPGTESVLPADTVILAIGQVTDLSWIQAEDGIEVTPRLTIAIDPKTLATSAAGVFAGGDVAFGPRLLIDAVADGQKAARSIDQYLRGKRPTRKRLRLRVLKDHRLPLNYEAAPRQPVPTLPVERRVGVAEVEVGYTEDQALAEARRCLHCNIETIFDATKCVLCGGCVDVCPEFCLKLVPLTRIVGDGKVARLLETRYGPGLLPGEPAAPGPLDGKTALLKDSDFCIRCGLCARRCPTGAITMEAAVVEEVEEHELAVA